ncbi:MAG: thioredoxin-disulfide reductase [Candidatus Omnitrophica bacterium CG_4_9_14_0_2_um_filter_42_8]|nr:MAG: thioredoxin-disulfide reductase [Candidatus Omnitrophica bacterium CG22_combo_CG10-13_8_21_14_all_43_16]PJC48776.1 MAG: thioredoxin-disulfide reductase [Candidatus Omnitrophica bacterium CG_4_9_14_0_2_um_filter_42_8]
MNYDCIIIGGGPAGLTAGIYASRARLKTLLIESYSVACQAVTTDHIENYPGFPDGVNGFELIEKFKKQAEKFGVEFIAGEVKAIKENKSAWEILTDDLSYTGRAVIIASGARPKRLDIPGEDKFRGKGVSYCATCDGALFKNKEVVVAGGGDTALEEAIFLTRFAKKVSVIHRRNALRGTKILQERAFSNKKIEFVWDSVISEILGDARVSAVKVKNVKTGAVKDLSCDGVFIFVGYTPNTAFLKDLLTLDESGYIIADVNSLTSKAGIFACGDCCKKLLRQVVTAAGDGAVAAFSCQHYLESA